MSITKRELFASATVLGVASRLPAEAADLAQPGFDKISEGTFKPDWKSLQDNYQAPDWFRDAKFGIWAHWGPQCVPEAGDWYARNMYMQGSGAYTHFVKTYGHPADTGFIDLLPKWTAENWNPDDLLDLYTKAGAKYFMAMANHHDNFDMYASRFHDWNSTRIGPKKDIIGIWEKAVRKRGLRFGVSNHSAHAWHWFQTAYGYDAEGPRKGERYDAYKLSAVDGKGKWWEGLDPKSFYGDPVMALPNGFDTITAAHAWHELNDRVWDEKPPLNNPAFTRQWFLRCKDLIDSYKPDMVYFDNFDLPLGQVGLDITAHFYNASAQWNKGKVEGVVNIKPHGPFNGGVVVDVERGSKSEIDERPWQTCTCIGQWHYNRRLYTEKKYLPAADVIHRLCDIISKNGNLLLSVPLRADGSIDSEERRIVEEIAGWMSRFGDAIYGTRPWRIFGEGPTQVGTGMFGERDQKSFTSEDIRFTTKAKALYAIPLGRPAGSVTIKSLNKREQGRVKRVEVVGSRDPLTFRQSPAGLVIDVPPSASHDFGLAFKIFGVL
ncbi:alpha-L-fucosidase [Asticcacaulis sp. AND118]|uniref:alpha-L-fucosidase n=1 Tax=Asticcacaulis sp. AND118 TaxID=2840468 RepID=UPI001CFFE5D7|nr:alpha-L-fucosidase [Asticcacaulis sp. AND118]UDF02595.1 alpha-L-fucosidase [Asticcacaulis sp. AND118]